MSNEIPVTHWKPILNFHVLNEKVDFERKSIPGEIYPFIRYDNRNACRKLKMPFLNLYPTGNHGVDNGCRSML